MAGCVACFAASGWILAGADMAWRKLFDGLPRPKGDYRQQRSDQAFSGPVSNWARLAQAEGRLADSAELHRRSVEELAAAERLLGELETADGGDRLLLQRARFAQAQTLEALARAEPERENEHLARALLLYEQVAQGGGGFSAAPAAIASAERLSRRASRTAAVPAGDARTQ